MLGAACVDNKRGVWNNPNQTMSNAETNEKTRLLITGGAGFLGVNLALKVKDDFHVVLLDNFVRDSLRYLSEEQRAGLEVINGDITDAQTVEKAVDGCDLVVHMAAIAGVSNYYDKPYEVMRVNLGGTLNLLSALSNRPPRRLLFVSTSEVYGQQADNAEEDQTLAVGHYAEPRWTYAISKIAAEKACLAWGKQLGVEVVCLRPFNVFGPGQTGEGAIRDMIAAALAGQNLTVHGDGSQVRAWCFVDDFTAAAHKALTKPGLNGEVFNIGNPGNAVTVAELAETVVRLCDSESQIERKPHFGVDIARRTPNVEQAKEKVGFSAWVGLEEGLRRTIDWMKTHG